MSSTTTSIDVNDFALLIEILAETLGVPTPQISASSRLVDDLGVDSLDITGVVIELEHRTGRDLTALSEQPMGSLVTVADLGAFLFGRSAPRELPAAAHGEL